MTEPDSVSSEKKEPARQRAGDIGRDRQRYATPRLDEYGSVHDLTRGTGGGADEGFGTKTGGGT